MKVNYVITSILALFSIISKVPYYDKKNTKKKMDDNRKIPTLCGKKATNQKTSPYRRRRHAILSEEEKQEVRERERERKRKQRANYNEAQREEMKKMDRERKAQQRAGYSEEQKE